MRRSAKLQTILLIGMIPAAIAAIVVPSYLRAREGAQSVRCYANLLSLHRALEAYTSEHKYAAPDLDTLMRLGFVEPMTTRCPVNDATYVYLPRRLNGNPGAVIAFDPICAHTPYGGFVLFGDGHADRIPREQFDPMIGHAISEFARIATTRPALTYPSK